VQKKQELVMPKLIISIDGVVIKEVQLTKDRTTLGRRPYNDIVIDNLAVSGEHALLQIDGDVVAIEDLNSTNGTYINGKAIKKSGLMHNDTIEVGKHKIKFLHEMPMGGFNQTIPMGIDGMVFDDPPEQIAGIRVVSGAAAGREVMLTKVVTTIGKPGVAVAAITRRPKGYVVALVEGIDKPTLNDQPLDTDPVALKDGDMLALAGTKMQFFTS
jgi:pSer/pThr/pTyr-binding forkhead associated (FHA) protein